MKRASRGRSIPVDRLTLRFHSRDLEEAYARRQLARSIVVYRVAVALSVLIHIAYLPLDMSIIGEHARPMWLIRLLVCIPGSLLGLWASFSADFHRWSQSLTAVVASLHGLSMVAGHSLFGVPTTMYFVPGLVMVVMYGYVLLGLRFVYSTVMALGLVALELTVVVLLETPVDLLANATQVLLFSTIILGVGAYRMEMMSRTEFWTAEQLLYHERQAREVEAERGRWLGLIAGFVRHELKNAIAGIGSSLQLVSRAQLDTRSQEYVGRAERSLQYMRRFLQQVGDASSLESALRQQEREPVMLSELVAGRVDDFRQQFPEKRFETCIDDGVRVLGTPDSLVQMLDKLANNAVEHAAPGTTVSVSLNVQGDYARLTVADRGDPLPEDPDGLFEPFVSRKSRPGDGNLGLGLYVAKVIAVHHDGEISADPLIDPTGARFVVRLPLAREASQACQAVTHR